MNLTLRLYLQAAAPPAVDPGLRGWEAGAGGRRWDGASASGLGLALVTRAWGRTRGKARMEACGLMQSFQQQAALAWSRGLSKHRSASRIPTVSQASGVGGSVLTLAGPRPAAPHPCAPSQPQACIHSCPRSVLAPCQDRVGWPCPQSPQVGGNWAVNKRGSLGYDHGNWCGGRAAQCPEGLRRGAQHMGSWGPP